jgi:hypothetical protein
MPRDLIRWALRWIANGLVASQLFNLADSGVIRCSLRESRVTNLRMLLSILRPVEAANLSY